jgi:hypothetical protein
MPKPLEWRATGMAAQPRPDSGQKPTNIEGELLEFNSH